MRRAFRLFVCLRFFALSFLHFALDRFVAFGMAAISRPTEEEN